MLHIRRFFAVTQWHFKTLESNDFFEYLNIQLILCEPAPFQKILIEWIYL